MKLSPDTITRIEALVTEGFISRTKHDTEDLYILNYTQKCQYTGTWNEETMMCRGLIVDGEWEVKARPFKKFFNLEQHLTLADSPPLPWDLPYAIEEKMDGSLGILYWIGETPYIATRGSFNSDQAIKATEMLRTKYADAQFITGCTYLFEIIYPQNRIVVDYGKEEKLVLLAILITETGESVGTTEHDRFEMPKQYPADTPQEQLRELVPNDGSTEGLVIVFQDGTRVKVKTEEYVRLHRLMTEVSSKSIWDLLRNGTPLDELIEKVPDEFYTWVKSVKDELERQFQSYMTKALFQHQLMQDWPRKDAALELLKGDKVVAGATFALLDGRMDKATDAIWKALKPEYERPFKQDIDL